MEATLEAITFDELVGIQDMGAEVLPLLHQKWSLKAVVD